MSKKSKKGLMQQQQLFPVEGETVPKLRFPEFRDAREWEENTFGSAATFINGKAYKQEELLDKGKYRVLRVGNFFSNKGWYYSNLELDENKYCDNGDLLYAWSASFGPRIWQGEKIIYHYHIWKVLERKGVNREFLFILLGYETERMKAQTANGLGLLHITKGAIEQWRCYIPKSKEQQKIADCLSSIDDLITAQAKKIESLKDYKKGLMQQLFPAEGEAVPKLRFPEFWDSEEWGRIYLGECLDYLQPTEFLVSSTAYDDEYTTPVLTAGKTFILGYTNEIEGVFDENLPVIIFDDFTTVTKYVDFPFKAKSSAMKILLAKKEVSIKFCYESMQIFKYEVGVHKRHWISVFSKLSISMPSPKEQQKIADCLSSIDELISAQIKKLETLKAHKKGLMQQLFPVDN